MLCTPTSLAINTHSPHTLSNLKQPRGKKCAGGGGGKQCFNLPFSRKNAEALLPGTACARTHIHTLAAPLCDSKTSINARSKIYSSEKLQPKAFQGRQLGCRACGLTEKACRLRLQLTRCETTHPPPELHCKPNNSGDRDRTSRKDQTTALTLKILPELQAGSSSSGVKRKCYFTLIAISHNKEGSRP